MKIEKILFKIEEKRLAVFETRCYRRMLRIKTGKEHVTNDKVFRKVGETKIFLKISKQKNKLDAYCTIAVSFGTTDDRHWISKRHTPVAVRNTN